MIKLQSSTFCNNIFTSFWEKLIFPKLRLLPAAVLLPTVLYFHNLTAQNLTFSLDSKTLTFGPTGTFEAHNSPQINPEKRALWTREAIQRLRSNPSDSIDETIIFQTVDLGDYKKTYIRVQQPSVIQFKDGSSASIVLHSVHEDPEIGDVSLLMSGDKIFVNYGHICGGIMRFYTPAIYLPENIKDFVDTFFSEAEGLTWEKYINKKKNGEY